MKLYHISQVQNSGYDTYDSAVVAAENDADAATTHPDGSKIESWEECQWDWCSSQEHVSVKYIGEAAEGIEAGVICASFNAG